MMIPLEYDPHDFSVETHKERKQKDTGIDIITHHHKSRDSYSLNSILTYKTHGVTSSVIQISQMGFPKLFLFFFFLLVSNPSRSYAAENVSVTLYYETLCPYCADFIVNHLAKIFDNGLISVVTLRMVPWGNAWLNSDGSFACQHGTDECLLNTIEACTITIYPNVNRHFRFIQCVERLTLQNKHNKWADCFEMSKLGTVPIDCYNSGYGNQIETKYAKETIQLNPPHKFVPWLVINNKPLAENYDKFMTYICQAYKGKSPEACRSIRSKTESSGNERSIPQVCLVEQGRNSTS
uniref:gamma-interferon-inducible lysosomal thiol reductase-like isoform X1 n=1 Tax=Fragaria vesca subsp. vesca TaxID=101020 RepID=UPI0005C9A0DD|nr:PREDICTED: gamma-interferon-inducible lysosomal thiol reductase-like isoform X1 [Fragaria vesca subsp. vesca]